MSMAPLSVMASDCASAGVASKASAAAATNSFFIATPQLVMAGLDPAIHFNTATIAAWMAGSEAGHDIMYLFRIPVQQPHLDTRTFQRLFEHFYILALIVIRDRHLGLEGFDRVGGFGRGHG